MTRYFEASDGRRIAYADTGGDRPAVLCLAGITRNMVDFEDLAARLAPRYRVIRTDYRGRGASEWAENPIAEYSLAIEGRDAIELLTHVGVDKVTVLGTSRGGLIGMLLAAGRQDLVSGLILNDIGPVVSQEGLAFMMTYLGLEPQAGDFHEAAAALRTTFGVGFTDLTEAQWMAFARRTYGDDGGRPILNYDPKLRDATAVALENALADLWQVFDAIRSPVLTLRGANSDFLSNENLAEMVRRRPDMAHVTVANRGHVPFLDEPEAVAAIDAFLARCAA